MSIQAVKLIKRSILYGAIISIIIIYILFCLNDYGFSCYFERLTHRPCIGCGATRAALSLIQLDFIAAIEYHPIYTLVLYPFLILFLVQDYVVCIMNVATKKKKPSLLTYLLYKG